MTAHDSDRLAVWYSNLGHVLTHMVTILYATAVLYLPEIFGLSYGEMLGFASLGLVLYGVAALPAGWLGDRWSQVGMMVVFFTGIGASAILIGTAGSSGQLVVGLSLLGLFASIYHPVGIAWLVASAHKQGMTLGVNGLFGSLGGAIAPPFVGLMIDFASWRAAFLVPGLVSIGVGVLLLTEWRRGRVCDVRSEKVAARHPGAGAMKRAFLVLTVTMACNGFVYAGLTNTMPKLFETGPGPDLASGYTEIGLYVGAVIACASLSGLLGGWLADRYSPRAVYITFWALLIVPCSSSPPCTVLAWCRLMAIVLLINTAFVAAENLLVARYTPFEWRSLAYGSKFVLALGIGGLTVELAGHLFDEMGNFDLLYTLLGAAAALATVAAVLLPGEAPRTLDGTGAVAMKSGMSALSRDGA